MSPLDMVHASERAEELRTRVAERQLRVNGHDIQVSISLGVAQFQYHESADQLIKRADMALYQAKEGGRNRVVLSHP